MKFLIVGGVAGGASTAARLRRLNEDAEVIMFEKGPHVSFSNCCLPYHLSETVKDADDLVLMCPEKFMKQYNIDARVNNEVVSINRDKKTVAVKNVLTGEEYEESYDKLILSPGAKPIVPPIPGIDKVNNFTVRNVVDIDKIKKFIDSTKPSKVTVIGGGFIGIECAENLIEAGFNVALVEALPQVLKQFDYDMVQILHKELEEHGVELFVDDKVTGFDTDKVLLESGAEIVSEAIIMAIGVSPETSLATDAGLELGETRAIKVDQNYLTSDSDIYAVGDAIEVYNSLLQATSRLPLAGPAQKQARQVADHIHGRAINNTGFIGSSVLKVFDYNAAATGLNEHAIKGMDLEADSVLVIPKDKVGLMPCSEEVHFKLWFEKPTGRILGAQAIGRGNVDKRVDVIATAIKFNATVENLKDLELCYAPPFGTAKDVVNMAGYVASNILEGAFKQVMMTEVRGLVESGACIIDVREEDEYNESHIEGAMNIPLSQIRQRLDEIPKDKNIYLHCRSGQRSYNAVLALQHLGFDKVFNISGGLMGVSFYEFFNDKKTGRKKIVNGYNFL